MLVNDDVARALRHLRGERPQSDLARRAGINRQTWNAYESGRRMPSPASWPRVLEALGVSEAELDRAIIEAWMARLGPASHGTASAWRLREQARTLQAEVGRLLELLGEEP